MTTDCAWGDLRRAEPGLAAAAEARLRAHDHHVVATVRPDGRPRVSGTTVMFSRDSMWVGAMPGAARTADMRRFSWCALHSAPIDTQLGSGRGDVRISARLRELTDGEVAVLWSETFPDRTDPPAPAGTYFELRPVEVELVEVHGDEMVILRWSPASGVTESRRRG